ncbi:zinc finger and BTB domain-containing protein 49-like [Periplaneta americana]|uniref:zinc finger and BTB domain-containing protein 49-like n=1 Tax=Periplaneta americana TaxID=6978 RepID=UPI0037E9AE04
MDVIKMQPQADPLSTSRNDRTNKKKRLSLDIDLKVESKDPKFGSVKEEKCEEIAVAFPLPALKCEPEEQTWYASGVKEEPVSEEASDCPKWFIQQHCDEDVKIEEHDAWEHTSNVEPTQSLEDQKQQDCAPRDDPADLKCEICGITFTLPLSLEVHRNTHLTEALLKCKICNKIIAHGYNMRAHELTHSVEKQFKCRFCDKRFAVGKYVQKHELFHKDERPFKCDICLKRFKLLGNVKVHMLTHSEQNRFKCHVCGKKFKDSKTFNDHILIHTSAQTL